jgi:hypothetical protein
MVFRQVVTTDALLSGITVPPNFRNKKVEVIIRPIDEPVPLPRIKRSELDAMMEGSVALSLLGALPHADITLEEIKAERLARYERTD